MSDCKTTTRHLTDTSIGLGWVELSTNLFRFNAWGYVPTVVSRVDTPDPEAHPRCSINNAFLMRTIM